MPMSDIVLFCQSDARHTAAAACFCIPRNSQRAPQRPNNALAHPTKCSAQISLAFVSGMCSTLLFTIRLVCSPHLLLLLPSSLLFHHFARSSPPARLATMLALPLISILVLSLSLILLPAPASAGAFSHPAIRASLLQARQSSSQSPQDQATALICQANPQVANSDCTNNIGPQVQQTFSSYCSIPGTNATDEAADPPASCTDDA